MTHQPSSPSASCLIIIGLAHCIWSGADSESAKRVQCASAPGYAKNGINELQRTSHVYQKWVRQLGDPNFRVREQAFAKLKIAGVGASDAVLKGTSAKDLEIALRCIELLSFVLQKHDVSDKAMDVQSLRRLCLQKDPIIRRWAQSKIIGRCKNGNRAAQMALDELYPLPKDGRTKKIVKLRDNVLREIAKLQVKYELYKNNRMLPKVFRKDVCRGIDRNIRELREHYLSRWEGMLLEIRMQNAK